MLIIIKAKGKQQIQFEPQQQAFLYVYFMKCELHSNIFFVAYIEMEA